MRRSKLLTIFFMALVVGLAGLTLSVAAVSAQSGPTAATEGTPPLIALLSVSEPDADGFVTITGETGSVFPSAQVAVRNLYTEQTVYAQAGVAGGFSARIYGPGNTPFWISPAREIVPELRDNPGSLPGGPGTIIYGTRPTGEVAQTEDEGVTQLVIDGDAGDWQAYPQGTLQPSPERTVYALRNSESLYVSVSDASLPPNYQNVEVLFALDNTRYSLLLNPLVPQPALLRQVSPPERDLGTLSLVASQGAAALEVRFPLGTIDAAIDTATLERIRFLDADGGELFVYVVDRSIPLVNEIDGVVRANSRLGTSVTRFTLSGPVGDGAGLWTAQGRINQLDFRPGDELIIELDVEMQAPAVPAELVGLRMIGEIGMLPVVNGDGQQRVGGLNSNNGWSGARTPGGLAIDNLRGGFTLGQAITDSAQILRLDEGVLRFRMDFALTLPADLPIGMYVPTFEGFGQVGDGEIIAWTESGLFGAGEGISRQPQTRLPFVLNIGDVTAPRLLWSLFYDTPSDGSRGVLSAQDQEFAALSNRVRFNSPTYILPPNAPDGTPIGYPLEPYVVAEMANAYDTSAAPMIFFDYPGELSVSVTRPNGTVNDLGSASIVQGQLSTATVDERTRFGAQSPLDMYRLTTLNPLFTNYAFDQYGLYQINVTGSVEDIWGNRYEGGGTYSVLVAEQIEMLPGVLSGTPFEVGDTLYAGARVVPGFPADITVTVRVYPVDGGVAQEQVIQGRADIRGFFQPEDSLIFQTPGEYIIDYEARYAEPDGRLWAASVRSAGVIATPATTGSLILHGQRGLMDYEADVRPAWYGAQQYAPEADAIMNYPYFTGDVAWIEDDNDSGINPVLRVQDHSGVYANWLAAAEAAGLSFGRAVAQLAIENELPVVLVSLDTDYGTNLTPQTAINEAYSYVSAVRPGIALRQFVAGGHDGGLSFAWDADDPFNGQIGAGVSGDRPGDYTFMFGGSVVRNREAGVMDTAIYAALAVTTSPNDPRGSRVFPPYTGQAGGPSGGPLFVVRDEPIDIFFQPTGARPGQVFTVGDSLRIAGQVAPPLPSNVSIVVTSPNGETSVFGGRANSIGYYYQPEDVLELSLAGVWTVDLVVEHQGLSSAGEVQPPFPTGGVLGEADRRFEIYVVPTQDTTPEDDALPWAGPEDGPFPAGLPYNFSFEVPAEWTDIRAYHTVSTPSYILSSGTVQVNGRTFTYQYNPTQLSLLFPFLETDSRTTGPAASDMVTLTFFATGEDAIGLTKTMSRTFVIMHDRLFTLN